MVLCWKPCPSATIRTPDLLWTKTCWNQCAKEVATDQVEVLLEKIGELRARGLTGARVYMRFLQWRIQPLRVRQNPGYQYLGEKYLDWNMPEILNDSKAFVYVKRYIREVTKIPPANPPAMVSELVF